MVVKFRTDWFSQERIVFLLAAILFLVASFSLKGFFTPDNLVAIVRSVCVLGILAVGMAIVVIGRGIDLSAVAIMAMSVAWYLAAPEHRNCRTDRLALALGFVLLIGLVNGFLVAYADVPAIFATLASGAFVFGFVRSQLIRQDAIPVPPGTGSRRSGGSACSTCRSRCSCSPALAFLAVALPALHQMGPLRLSDGRQSAGGAQHGHSGTPDDWCCAT